MSQTQEPVLLTVRGTLVPNNLESARVLHNDTAGSPPGIAAARSLGDLSHKVYAPCLAGAKLSDAKAGEVLFLDVWTDPGGIQTFFSNPHVGEQGTKLFQSKEPAVWMPARGASSFHLPAPMNQNGRYVGMIRGRVNSPEQAVEAFRTADTKFIRAARQAGQISHELYFKLGPPNEPAELLGVDHWFSLEGMLAHYSNMEHMAPLAPIFAGRPAASIWEQALGNWSEW